MTIQDEVAVRSLLVLADTGLDQRGIFHRWKSDGNVFADAPQSCLTDNSLSLRGIELAASGVIGDLETAAAAARDAVEKAVAVIAPHRKLRIGKAKISGGSAEEENILLGCADYVAKSFRE